MALSSLTHQTDLRLKAFYFCLNGLSFCGVFDDPVKKQPERVLSAERCTAPQVRADGVYMGPAPPALLYFCIIIRPADTGTNTGAHSYYLSLRCGKWKAWDHKVTGERTTHLLCRDFMSRNSESSFVVISTQFISNNTATAKLERGKILRYYLMGLLTLTSRWISVRRLQKPK